MEVESAASNTLRSAPRICRICFIRRENVMLGGVEAEIIRAAAFEARGHIVDGQAVFARPIDD